MARNPVTAKSTPSLSSRWLRRLPFPAFAVLCGIAVLRFSDAPHQNGASKQNVPVSTASRIRRIYPYSVIPGGALSSDELRHALLRDNVAAVHYAGFDVHRTRIEHLTKARLVYVSYRIAERVYWTRKRIRLPRGETILTDGVNSARTRCGNRIADSPQAPSRVEEPTEVELNSGWSEEEATTSTPKDSHLLGKEQIGRGVIPPLDYLAAFGPSPEPSIGGGPGTFGGGPPPGTGTKGGAGFPPSPPTTETPGAPLKIPRTNVVFPAVLLPQFPGDTNQAGSPSILFLPTTLPRVVPLLVPTLSPENRISALGPGPSLLNNSVNFVAFPPALFFFSAPAETGSSVTNQSFRENLVESENWSTQKHGPDTDVNAPEPGTIVITALGVALLLFAATRRSVLR